MLITAKTILQADLYKAFYDAYMADFASNKVVEEKAYDAKAKMAMQKKAANYASGLSKDLADELFYQGLLKAGISKSKASVAKWAVEHLAGLHYGKNNDDFNISPYVHLEAL